MRIIMGSTDGTLVFGAGDSSFMTGLTIDIFSVNSATNTLTFDNIGVIVNIEVGDFRNDDQHDTCCLFSIN